VATGPNEQNTNNLGQPPHTPTTRPHARTHTPPPLPSPAPGPCLLSSAGRLHQGPENGPPRISGPIISAEGSAPSALRPTVHTGLGNSSSPQSKTVGERDALGSCLVLSVGTRDFSSLFLATPLSSLPLAATTRYINTKCRLRSRRRLRPLTTHPPPSTPSSDPSSMPFSFAMAISQKSKITSSTPYTHTRATGPLPSRTMSSPSSGPAT
jgi:hypothetical protein